MKVSAHLITWGGDWEVGMRELSGLGFTACETFTHIAMAYEDKVDEFKELLASHGLRLSALYGGGQFSNPDKRDEVIEHNARVAKFLAANGVDRIVFGPGGPRNEGGTTREGLEIAAKTMEEAAKRCLDVGVKACLHPHLFTEIETQDELDFIMDNTSPEYVGFTPDTAHLTAAGIDVPEILRTYRDRLDYLHVKDLRPGFDPAMGFQVESGGEQLPIFCELGVGTIDLPKIFATLDDIGYDGWITVEIDQSTTTPRDSLETCRDYLVNKLNLQLA
jgi:inosose dehydratase